MIEDYVTLRHFEMQDDQMTRSLHNCTETTNKQKIDVFLPD